ncbi:hypothetical protein H0H92_009239 [Tricholoma furcatifolium]|nr:hypothetical protein H0H92_009239 [Tricholoma furcatifolium]
MHPSQHDPPSHAIRVRHKPSSRSRNDPRIEPWPQFPPPGIVLHPDDANSKVFLAIGRAFLSVDNCAMTIKDLAEMTVLFGLSCQNLSAANQAITTYIRSHIARCESQQDQPLLLRHTLSGTPDDDDLLPALFSHSGGATCNNPHDRLTNFRRGTVVWYLSRSTGSPCPFARAGIRLCDYDEEGKKEHSAEKKKNREDKKKRREREPHEQCGEKRKRPLRTCVAKNLESDNDEGQPLPKVKLTLRLKPLQRRTGSPTPSTTLPRSQSVSSDTDESDTESSDDDSMSVDSSLSEEEQEPSLHQQPEEESWSLPPYPRKSVSIPSYTPSSPDVTEARFSSPFAHPQPYNRSPSVASPPPDSEDEDDDFHITMTGARRPSAAHLSSGDTDGWDADLDSEGDNDTWESPGPRSPSAPAVQPEITVKEEPTDVQGMLDAWDDYDHSFTGAKVVEAIAQAAASVLEAESTSRFKLESLDNWSWEAEPYREWPFHDDVDQTTRIKQEDLDLDNSFLLSDAFAPSSSPLSPLSHPLNVSYHDSPSPESSRDALEWNDKYYNSNTTALHRPRAKTEPEPFSYFHNSPPTALRTHSVPLRGTAKPDLVIAPPPQSASHSLTALIQSLSMNSPSSAVAPSSLLIPPSSSPSQSCSFSQDSHGNSSVSSDVVVVHTCQPCTPAISATSIEGISVYQMMLGSFQLLRRIDTDFVNLSTIVAYSGGSWPVLSTIPNAVQVTKGSVTVSGTWVPLPAAQAYVRDHHQQHAGHPGQGQNAQDGPLQTFLSDTLFEKFPQALQDFHRSSVKGRMVGHFGPHFGSTIQATRLCGASVSGGAGGMEAPHPQTWDEMQPVPATSSAFALSMSMSMSMGSPDRNNSNSVSVEAEELPLSPSEQEMFHVLCGAPEWDKENSPPSSPVVPGPSMGALAAAAATTNTYATTTNIACEPLTPVPVPAKPAKAAVSSEAERPLRRSKRVADAMAAQTQNTRTHSRRGSTRNSLF